MSKQFRFYLLPADIESLMDELRLRVGVKIIQEMSFTPRPVEMKSPLQNGSNNFNANAMSIGCYLVSPIDAEIKLKSYPTRAEWIVQIESEVIEFRGCDYNGDFLLGGRLYFQSDVFLGDSIWPKRKEFTDWADKLFRVAKRMMRYSTLLQAYVGKEADQWRRSGGKFVLGFKKGGQPVFEEDERLHIN